MLNSEIFETLLEAKVLNEEWRKEYNPPFPIIKLYYSHDNCCKMPIDQGFEGVFSNYYWGLQWVKGKNRL